MRTSAIAVALMLAGAVPARAQEEDRTAASKIKDSANLFSPGVIRRAEQTLESIEQKTGVPVTIETVETLEGQGVDEAAQRRAEQSNNRGIYILLAKREHKISDLQINNPHARRLTADQRRTIRDSFVEEFKHGRYGEGLRAALLAISQELGAGSRAGDAVPSARTEGGTSSSSSGLVVRDQVRLTLAGARKIIAGAEAKAAEMNLKANIAVVDDGGHLLSFARMDGARPASGYTAMTKATAAATFRAPTGPVSAGSGPPDPLLNLSLQNAAAASGGKVTTLHGGVPVVLDGQVIGAVGVGGGSGEQDAQVARAGIAAFTSELEQAARPKADEEKPK